MTLPPATPPAGPPPPPAAPRRRPGRRLLIIIGVVVVVCCGGTVAAGYALLHGYGAGAGPAQAAAEGFFTDLEKDDTAAAYARLCPPVRAGLSLGSFTDLVHAQPRLRGHRIVGTSVVTVNGRRTAEITADLDRDGGHERRVVPVVENGTAWLVCGSPY